MLRMLQNTNYNKNIIDNTLSNFASTEVLDDELLFKIRDYMK